MGDLDMLYAGNQLAGSITDFGNTVNQLVMQGKQLEQQKDWSDWNKETWQKNFDYQKYVLENQAQIRSKDLKAAGLNPVLAAGAPAMSSAPVSSGTQAQQVRPGQITTQSSMAAAALDMQRQQLAMQSRLTDAEVRLKNSQAAATDQGSNIAASAESRAYTRDQAELGHLALTDEQLRTMFPHQIEQKLLDIAHQRLVNGDLKWATSDEQHQYKERMQRFAAGSAALTFELQQKDSELRSLGIVRNRLENALLEWKFNRLQESGYENPDINDLRNFLQNKLFGHNSTGDPFERGATSSELTKLLNFEAIIKFVRGSLTPWGKP